MQNTRTLIIGNGEIGKSLFEVLSNVFECSIRGKDNTKEHFDIIHICFPYDDTFISEVKRYQKLYSPTYTVIHSTVPVGTSRKCEAIHSPVRGIHPYLARSLKTFVKFVGGEKADEVADYFRRAGMRVYMARKPETTELLKLLSTETYREHIKWAQKIEGVCQKYDVPFSEVYTLATQTYNDGYRKLGYPEYHRPILQPLQKKIDGHCVEPNHKIIEQFNIMDL